VVLLAQYHRLLDLVRVQIATTPDDIAITASRESLRRAATTFLLTFSRVSVDLFELRDGVTVPAQPLVLARRDIRIDRDLAGSGVLAVTDNDDAMFGSERSQTAAVQAFDRDMKHTHDPAGSRFAPRVQ